MDSFLRTRQLHPGVYACTCYSGILEAEFSSGVCSVPVGGYSP